MRKIPLTPEAGAPSWKEGPMDRSVDQATGTITTDQSDPPETAVDDNTVVQDSTVVDDSESADIESELLASTREMGISAVGFGPVDDA